MTPSKWKWTALLSSMFLPALFLPLSSTSCSEELGEDYCEEPGSSEKCTCPGGRTSVRTCDAFNTWGSCYCSDPPSCGNGTVDAGEECDDGNTEDGDGCSNICLVEGGVGGAGGTGTGIGPGGGGTGGIPSTGGMGGAPGGMGGAPGGMGGMGGAPGGMGGAPGGMGGMATGGAGGA